MLDGGCSGAVVNALRGRPNVEVHVYPGVDHAFARVGGEHYHRASALMAHERSIAALKNAIGPHDDLAEPTSRP